MGKKEFIEKSCKKLIQSGSFFQKELLWKFKKELESLLEYPDDQSFSYIMKDIEKAEKNLYQDNVIHGLSTSIAYSESYIHLYSGKNVCEMEIKKDTAFDIASITKLFTVLLAFRLNEIGFFSFHEKIKEIENEYAFLEDITIYDLLKMNMEIRTPERIDAQKTKKDALKLLRQTYIYQKNREKNTYTDIGFMILTDIFEKKAYVKTGKRYSYENLMYEFLLKPLSLDHTGYLKKENIAGNGRKDGRVHDPKARKMEGIIGSAGIFTTNEDLYKIYKNLIKQDFFSSKHIKLLHTNLFGNAKGIGGLYQKYPDEGKTYVPKFYSDSTFASEGFTGSVAIFDLENHFHNAILVDAIECGELVKPENFRSSFANYLKQITYDTLLLDRLSKYHQKEKKFVLKRTLY